MATHSRVRVSPLGGVGEVGKNSTLIEFGEDMIIVDAGVKFPEAELHGVDLVVCDYGYIGERLCNLLLIMFALFHADHIRHLSTPLIRFFPLLPISLFMTTLTFLPVLVDV